MIVNTMIATMIATEETRTTTTVIENTTTTMTTPLTPQRAFPTMMDSNLHLPGTRQVKINETGQNITRAVKPTEAQIQTSQVILEKMETGKTVTSKDVRVGTLADEISLWTAAAVAMQGEVTPSQFHDKNWDKIHAVLKFTAIGNLIKMLNKKDNLMQMYEKAESFDLNMQP